MIQSSQWIAAIFALALATGCGKSVRLGEVLFDSQSVPTDLSPKPSDGSSSVSPAPDSELECQTWRFEQPAAEQVLDQEVDVLFVVDTSDSLRSERSRVATNVSALISQLPPDGDHQFAVMLAHGGASYWSGRLYPASGSETVLSTERHALNEIQEALDDAFRFPAKDIDEANGEMLQYSLLRGLNGVRLERIRSQGFLRESAALAIVLVSDENDACFRPELNGYTTFPDFVRSGLGWEDVAYSRYCLGASGELAVHSAALREALSGKTASISLAAITHLPGDSVPTGGEDAIGHGLIELVEPSPNGVLIDIEDESYALGLGELGHRIRTRWSQRTAFQLDGATAGGELSVAVDGAPVQARLDDGSNAFTIDATHAGGPGSIIEAQLCR